MKLMKNILIVCLMLIPALNAAASTVTKPSLITAISKYNAEGVRALIASGECADELEVALSFIENRLTSALLDKLHTLSALPKAEKAAAQKEYSEKERTVAEMERTLERAFFPAAAHTEKNGFAGEAVMVNSQAYTKAIEECDYKKVGEFVAPGIYMQTSRQAFNEATELMRALQYNDTSDALIKKEYLKRIRNLLRFGPRKSPSLHAKTKPS